MRTLFSLLLIEMLLFSLRVVAMVDEEKNPIKCSRSNEALSTEEVTARNRRLYDSGKIDENDSLVSNEEQIEEGDFTNFHEEALFQKWREAEEAAIFWRTKYESFTPQTLILSDAERSSIIEEAHRACDYWTQASHECSDFIQRDKELDVAHQTQILDLITAANNAVAEVKRTLELLLEKSFLISADPIKLAQQHSQTKNSIPEKAIASFRTDLSPIRNSKVFSSPLNRSATLIEGGYLFPDKGRRTFNGLKYTQHALERMAPATPEIIKLLRSRAFEKAKLEGLNFEDAHFDDKNPLKLSEGQSDSLITWWCQNGPDLRAILPSDVEAEISNPNSTNLKVITSPEGLVITVMRKSNSKNSLSSSSLLTLKSSIPSYSPLFYAKLFNNSPTPLKPKILTITKNKLLCLKLRYFKLHPLFDGFSPSSSELISFADHKAQLKKHSRLFKNIDAIRTLQRKKERDLKLRKSEGKLFWDAQMSSISEINRNTLPTMTAPLKLKKFRIALFRPRLLETVLQKMRKRALKNSRLILRKNFLAPIRTVSPKVSIELQTKNGPLITLTKKA